jgi:hypothetical protein
MGVPRVYRNSGEGVIATYNFFDIAGGSGIVTFYGATDQSGNGILTNNAISTDSVETAKVITSDNFTKEIDKDFDVTINKATTVDGITTINVPLTLRRTNGAPQAYITAKLRKYSGTTETEIASGTSATITEAIDDTYNHDPIVLIRFDTPQTVFKRGDILRVTLEVYAKIADAANYVIIAHDPKGRYNTYMATPYFASPDSTQFIVNLPIKIDL